MQSLIEFQDNEYPCYRMLVDYLIYVRHDDIDALRNVSTLTIVQDTYKEFFLHLSDTLTVREWFPLFKNYCQALFVPLDRGEFAAALCLRSYEFAEFTKQVPGIVPDDFCLN